MAALVVKRVLMIAYHYPPVRGSSGVQRTLKFTRYLPDHGWEPVVLTVNPRAYAQTGEDQLHEIPADITVRRTFALDTSRHLAFKGRYPGTLALPDRWASWWLSAVPAGLRLIKTLKPAAIWSTYPIATAHLIALSLAKLTRLPWIADFRDSMTEDNYPADLGIRRIYRWIEASTVTRATRAVFTSPGTVRMYAKRYPALPASRWATIANGYDEENFSVAADTASIPGSDATVRETEPLPFRLIHSGLIYPSERDPTAFFDALAEMKVQGDISARTLSVILRASGYDALYRPMLIARNLVDIVQLEPAIPYGEALTEMLRADGLLVLQAANCNHQIPAKIYEYMRARRPVFALTDITGDTAQTLKQAGLDTMSSLTDSGEIRRELNRFIKMVTVRSAPVASEAAIARYSRRSQTAELADVLNAVSRAS